MRLSKATLRVSKELTLLTPEAWGLVDEELGPFRFRVTARPPTTEYRAILRGALAQRSDAIAARAAGNKEGLKALSKLTRKRLSAPASVQRARDQKEHDAIRTQLLVEISQEAGDGTVAALDESEVEALFTLPAVDDTEYHVVGGPESPAPGAAVAGYTEDEIGGEDLYALIERNGEALAAAVARFVAFVSFRAERQREEEEEKSEVLTREEEKSEVLTPLASTPGSTPGSPRAVTPIRSSTPAGSSAEAGSAPDAAESGSPGGADPAREATG